MTIRNDHGFTLIEMILALVVSSILAVMLTTFLGGSLTKSNDPLVRLRDTLDLYSVMERIHTTYDYSTQTLADLKTAVGTAADNPHTNTYGTYNVEYNGYVTCDALLTTTFTSGGSSILMVTISDPANPGIRVTTLFTD